VRLLVAPESVAAVQAAAPEAIAHAWGDDEEGILEAADALVLGPGLGRSEETRRLVERVLRGFRGPVVVDADALNLFEGDAKKVIRFFLPNGL
jgi:NAD(P)H-hydrate epimerase